MSPFFWFFFNILLILSSGFYIWVVRPHQSILVLMGQFLAQGAILLFLINLNMYFIFLVIKRTHSRTVKVTLAKLSRKMMKVHIPIAIFGTSIILLHAFIMIMNLGPIIHYLHPKMISGYTAITFLALTLLGGYRRHKKASGFRRKFHLIMALLFGFLFIVHLFIPISS